MAPKAKTLIERFGFRDDDRKKPKHDEIQIWVYRNFQHIIRTLFPSLDLNEVGPLQLELERAVATDRNFVVGFIDVYCRRLALAVEVKTEIKCIGELVRQIQFYRNYLGGVRWIVVSPDDRSSGILREQGIEFYRYSVGQKELAF